METQLHLPTPLVIIVRGLPGSGKTYIATELAKRLGQEVIMLDPDATDYESQAYHDHVKAQIAEGVDPKLHAYRFLRAQAYDGIANGKVVIWNQPFTNLEIFHRVAVRLHDHAEAHNKKLHLLIIEVEINPEVAKQRVVKRKEQGGHGPSNDTFARFTNDYKTFAQEGYSTVTVQGEDDVTVSVDSIIEAIKSLSV